MSTLNPTVIPKHREHHLVNRIGWLRAAVLGANDGIVSISSLIVGVAAASASQENILIAGAAGLAAGAMSMAAGEYVSVSSQSDTEQADLEKERIELEIDPEGELHELAVIYQDRGLDPDLSMKVAVALTKADALGTHAREELGITEISSPNPIQAAFSSGVAFAIGAAIPLIAAAIAPVDTLILWVIIATLFALIALGALGAYSGGAKLTKGAIRVSFWGAIAMAITAGVGHLVGGVI